MKKLLAILLLGMAFAGQITERVYMTPTANGRYQSATMQIIGSGNIISANNTQGITVKSGVGNFNVHGTVSANQSQFNQQPKALVRLANTILLSANREINITFDTEISDDSDMYSGSVFTATSNGTYMFSYNIGMTGTFGSNFYFYIYKSGTKITYQVNAHVANQRDNRANTMIFILNKGDTIQLKVESNQNEQVEGNITAQLYTTYANFVKLF